MNAVRCLSLLLCMALSACAIAPDRSPANVGQIKPQSGGSDTPTRCENVGSGAERLDPTRIRGCGEAAQATWLAQPLTAQRALQAALAQNHELQAELARLDAIEAERVQAGLLRNPMLSLMLLQPEGGGRLAIEAGWMQSLFDLLTRSRRVDLADANARRDRAEIGVRLLEVGWLAQTAFYEAVAAGQRARLLQQELALDAQALDLQSRITRSGLAAQSELLTMQAMQDERRHMLHELHAQTIEAQSMLAERIGLESRHGLQLPEDFELPEMPDRDVEAWQQRALAERRELVASAAAVAAASAERALETGSWRKTEPDIGARIERDAEGMAMTGPELRVALPVFDNGRVRADRADALVREATHRDVGQRRNVLLAVERALDLLLAAADQATGTAEHLARTQVADALAERQHRNGSIGLIERISAQRAVLAAERQRLDARLALARAHVELQRAVGGGGG